MTYDFYAKINFIDNTIDSCEVFHYGLDSFEPNSRPVSEWIREHLDQCYTTEQLREILNIPDDGDYQVIFKGIMDGYENFVGEWEEDFEVMESRIKPIPDPTKD